MTACARHWAEIDPAERRARCRTLAALVRVFAGRAGEEAAAVLRAAEADPAMLAAADEALDALPSVPLRRALSSFAESIR